MSCLNNHVFSILAPEAEKKTSTFNQTSGTSCKNHVLFQVRCGLKTERTVLSSIKLADLSIKKHVLFQMGAPNRNERPFSIKLADLKFMSVEKGMGE